MRSGACGWPRKSGFGIALMLATAGLLSPLTTHIPARADKGIRNRIAAAPDWAGVERLIAAQRFEEAAGAAEKIRQAAQKAGNQDEWTRARVKEVQLRSGLA